MSIDDEITKKIINEIEINNSLKRQHANFWDFYKKSSKELGLFSEFFERFQKDYKIKIIEWGLCEVDPPDVFAKLIDGTIKGIEITELVNEKAIYTQINKPELYNKELFSFNFDKAVKKLNEIIDNKENKLINIGDKFQGLTLLIHTDEFLLKSEQFINRGSQIFPNGSKIFEGVYLVFSYEPDKKESPIVKLI